MDLEQFLAKHGGDALKALKDMQSTHAKELDEREKENAKLREQKRTLQTELDDTEVKINDARGKAIKDGEVIISAEDAGLLAKIKELGDLKNIVTELPKLREDAKANEALNRRNSIEQELVKAGVKPEFMKQAVKLLDGDEAYYTDKEVDVDGKKTTVKSVDATKFRESNGFLFGPSKNPQPKNSRTESKNTKDDDITAASKAVQSRSHIPSILKR